MIFIIIRFLYLIRGVQKEFINCIEDGGWETVMSAIQSSDELLLATLNGEEKKDYLIYREPAGGKGYADMVFIPRSNVNKPAIVVELKWNKTVSSAIKQIMEKQYVQSLKGYSGTVILVGVNYTDKDKQFKKHECRIEKISVNV